MEDYGLGAQETSILAGFIIVYLIVAVIFYLICGFFLGKVLEKAGKPLWAGFVPIYNLILVLEIVGRPIWWIALLLLGVIPFVGWIVPLVIGIIVSIDLAKSFGKDTVWGVLTFFFSIIMIGIMAFSDDIRYVGPSVAAKAS